MYCMGCGAQLPDEAKFCMECGKSLRPETPSDSLKWETCEIEWLEKSSLMRTLLVRAMGYFWAKAIGPNGVFDAGQTDTFTFGYPPSSSLRQ